VKTVSKCIKARIAGISIAKTLLKSENSNNLAAVFSIASAEVRCETPIAKTFFERTSSSPPSIENLL
jgi:hypothetical protein